MSCSWVVSSRLAHNLDARRPLKRSHSIQASWGSLQGVYAHTSGISGSLNLLEYGALDESLYRFGRIAN